MKKQKVYTISKTSLSSLKDEIEITSIDLISDGWKIKQISLAAVPETSQSYGRAIAVFLLEKYEKKNKKK